jgi:hypothetical protein
LCQTITRKNLLKCGKLTPLFMWSSGKALGKIRNFRTILVHCTGACRLFKGGLALTQG